jgi:hypothetical protein
MASDRIKNLELKLQQLDAERRKIVEEILSFQTVGGGVKRGHFRRWAGPMRTTQKQV